MVDVILLLESWQWMVDLKKWLCCLSADEPEAGMSHAHFKILNDLHLDRKVKHTPAKEKQRKNITKDLSLGSLSSNSCRRWEKKELLTTWVGRKRWLSKLVLGGNVKERASSCFLPNPEARHKALWKWADNFRDFFGGNGLFCWVLRQIKALPGCLTRSLA